MSNNLLRNGVLFLLFMVIICSSCPVYADDNASHADSREEFFYEQSVSYEVLHIIKDLGIMLYKKGRLDQAQQQFNMVLRVSPQDETALKYTKLIQKKKKAIEEKTSAEEEPPLAMGSTTLSKEEFIRKHVESMVLVDKKPQELPATPAKIEGVKEDQKISLPKILILGKKISTSPYSLEIEKNEIISIKGKSVRRFLVTQPSVISVEQKADALYITGENVGNTYLYIWDEQQRWIVEFKTRPIKGLDLEEDALFAEERAKDLHIRYSLLNTYSETKTPTSLSPSLNYHSLRHILQTSNPLETPYGEFGASLAVTSLGEKTDLSFASFTMRNGHIGTVKDVSLQAFDFVPSMADLSFSKTDLRGVQLSAPVFDRKLYYNFFWGQDIGIRFGGFSPPGTTLGKTKIYFGGLSLNYRTAKEENYFLSAYKGWGRDRTADQNPYAYDVKALYQFDTLKLIPEIAFDTKNFASLVKLNYSVPSLQIITQVRNSSRNFQAISGKDYRAGQKGVQIDCYYSPRGKVFVSSQLDIYQEGIYPNPDFPDRWNREVNLASSWAATSLLEATGDFTYRNNSGKNFPTLTQGAGLGLRYTLPTERRINLYLNYNAYQSHYTKTPVLDYRSNKITAGSRLNLLHSAYWFIEREVQWVRALTTDERVEPKVLQTGLEWSSQIFNSSFFQTTRFTYKDEENAASPFSFLVGEDYIEGYGEIAYIPNPYITINLNGKARQIRPEISPGDKRVEADFYVSMSYLFNTNIRLDPVGAIEGHVFEDLNFDGIRQENEPAIKGVLLRTSRHRSRYTNETGAYLFTKVKAKKVYLTLDASTLPEGFILNGPATQEVMIVHKGKTELNFAVSSRTEIQGTVFEDLDGDHKLSRFDKGLENAGLVLQDGTKIFTDSFGTFKKRLPPGKYRIRLDLESVPEMYIPTTPIFYEFDLAEGQSINYSIPLRRIR